MKHSPLIASACLALVLMSSSLIGSSEARNKKKYVGETGGDFEFIDEVSPKWLHGQPSVPKWGSSGGGLQNTYTREEGMEWAQPKSCPGQSSHQSTSQ